LRDYTLERRVGCSLTLRFITRNIGVDGDTGEIVGSDYRYTVVDTAFDLRGSRSCLAVQRETITNGETRLTDTTFVCVSPSEVINFERLTDTIGRRRLVSPVEVGITFVLRDNLGAVENNTYRIQDVSADVTTRVGTLSRCVYVKMASSVISDEGTTFFTDEVWLAPRLGIVKQWQTRWLVNPDGKRSATTILEFIAISHS
jgi:hypothetical protein